MNILDKIKNTMECVRVSMNLDDPQQICGFCDLYHTNGEHCPLKWDNGHCPAPKRHVYVKTTVVGKKKDFFHAHSNDILLTVLFSVWNYAEDMVASLEGAADFLDDLRHEADNTPLEHAPDAETIGLDNTYNDMIKKAWQYLMDFQNKQRTTEKYWWLKPQRAVFMSVTSFKEEDSNETQPQDAVPYEIRMKYIIKNYIALKAKYADLCAKHKELLKTNKEAKKVVTTVERLTSENEKLRNNIGKLRENFLQLSESLHLTDEEPPT